MKSQLVSSSFIKGVRLHLEFWKGDFQLAWKKLRTWLDTTLLWIEQNVIQKWVSNASPAKKPKLDFRTDDSKRYSKSPHCGAWAWLTTMFNVWNNYKLLPVRISVIVKHYPDSIYKIGTKLLRNLCFTQKKASANMATSKDW